MAGHSKFKNIQYRKGAQDKKRAKQFMRITREIITAAKDGIDEVHNPRLRAAINNARQANMPKDNITRAIKKSADKDGADYQDIRYEGFSADGVGVIIDSLSDNRNRTASAVRSVFSKFGGNLGENNAVAFMFEPMGEVFYSQDSLKTDKGDFDPLAIALEADVSDCHSNEDGHFFFCPRENIHQTASDLERLIKQPPSSQRLIWQAKNYVDIDDDGAENLLKLIDALDELDDVRYIFVNAKINGELLFYAPISF